MLDAFLSQWTMWASLIIVAASIVLYMSDKWSMELISAGIIVVLLVLFYLNEVTAPSGSSMLSATAILQGFGNPALITIMALLVIGQGLFQTGALDGPTKALLTSYDRRPAATLLMAFAAVFITSAFINNTPIVIMFLPVMSAFATRMGASPSKLMMPPSFVSVFAGMTTLIGTSTNLLVAESYRRIEDVTIGFFDLTAFGLVLSAIGMAYILITSRWLLPDREELSDQIASSSGKQYVAQLEVSVGHFLSGKAPIAGMFADLPGMTVRMIQRGERAILPPFEDVSLAPGDLVIVAATRQVLSDAIASKPDLLNQMLRGGEMDEPNRSLLLAEAVIAPGSRMAGRTVELLGFRRLTRAVVLGIQRRSRMIRSRLGEIRLEAGDTLLLCAPPDAFQEMRNSRDIILLEWSSSEIPVTSKARTARIIALLTVIAAATGLLPILHASISGAVIMIMANCLNIRQAGRSLDLRIFMLIGAALAMGIALEATGAVDLITYTILAIAEPYGKYAVLSAIFLLVALLTNILSLSLIHI